jgi:hypothetical protein
LLQVSAALRLVDTSINQRPTGWLHKGDVRTALAGFFKGTGKKVDRLDEASRLRVMSRARGPWARTPREQWGGRASSSLGAASKPLSVFERNAAATR